MYSQNTVGIHPQPETVETMKDQAWALSACLQLQVGFNLHHMKSLEAVAVMHGYDDWSAVAAEARSYSIGHATYDAPPLSMDEQALRLSEHLGNRYGLHLLNEHAVVAAVRRGALAKALKRIVHNPTVVGTWMNAPRREFAGQSAAEIIETDAGYEHVRQALHQI